MLWTKLLDTKNLIAYERNGTNFRVRIEARNRKKAWVIYKTYNFKEGDDWISHVREYVTKSNDETKLLLSELKNEKDISLKEIMKLGNIKLELQRCYKEDFVEKWKFKIDDFSADNFLMVRYDSEIKIDIVMHDRYNQIEKDVFNKIVEALGLKDISNKIKYDFFYFKKHSAKRRIYQSEVDPGMVAKLEFNIDPNK